jgi:hypothetical protein
MFAINFLCSGNAPRPFVFNNQLFLDRSVHISVLFPTLCGPVGLGIRNTGINNPLSTLANVVAPPLSAAARRTHSGNLLPAAPTLMHIPVPMYAGTTCHRAPSTLHCAITASSGSARLAGCIAANRASIAARAAACFASFPAHTRRALTTLASHSSGSSGR